MAFRGELRRQGSQHSGAGKSRSRLSNSPASPKFRSLPSGTSTTPCRRAQGNRSDLVCSTEHTQPHSTTPFTSPSSQSHLQCRDGWPTLWDLVRRTAQCDTDLPITLPLLPVPRPSGPAQPCWDQAGSGPEQVIPEVNLVSQAGKPVSHPPPQARGTCWMGLGTPGHRQDAPCHRRAAAFAAQNPKPFLLLFFSLQGCI